MLKKFLISLLMVGSFILAGLQSYAQRDWLVSEATPSQLAADLQSIGHWRQDQKQSILQAIGELPPAIRQDLIRNGERYLSFTWPALPATQYLEFAQNGNRSDYESSLGKRRAALSALVIAELAEDKGRFISQIINGVWATCEESTWALPAHLGLQKKYTALPEPGENIVDLGAGSTTALLSWTYFLLKDKLEAITPVIPGRMHKELEDRIIMPYLQRDDFWWMGFHGQSVNNWNPWVNQNVLLTSLLTEGDSGKLNATVYKTMQSVDHFINQYPADGGCDEGPAYWSAAGGKLITYLELLKKSTGGKIDITGRPLICNMGRYIYKVNIGRNSFVDFADAHPFLTPDISSILEYGQACGDDTLKQFASWFAAENGDAVNYFQKTENDLYTFIRYLKTYAAIRSVPPREPLPKLSWLPDLQVLTARGRAGSTDGLFLAAKGGTNGESHNHNDVGNFIIYTDGQPAIIDIGVGTYTRETFSKDRYKIFTMQSAWHNLPTINGIMQKEGIKYRASNVQYSGDGGDVHFSMNIAGAYPPEAGVRSWVRSLDFKGEEIVLREQYALTKYNSPFTLSLITPMQTIKVAGDQITLANESGQHLTIHFDPRHFEVKIEDKPLADPSLQHSWGKSLKRILLVDKSAKLKGNYTVSFR